MERAEEIKRCLKSQQQVPNVSRGEAVPPVMVRSACCVGEASGNTYDFSKCISFLSNINVLDIYAILLER